MEKINMISLETHVDDRGFLNQIFEKTQGLFPEIKRIYVVGNFGKGVVRGFHMHRKEWKYFYVLRGTAKFVAIKDKEKESKTFTLSDKKPSILVVPPDYYHGWVSLEEETILIGISNATLEESLKDDIRVDPYKFGDVWHVKSR
jgi:dTDP-4-dehydrorhamnose 3,5-epimerase-like enzyme